MITDDDLDRRLRVACTATIPRLLEDRGAPATAPPEGAAQVFSLDGARRTRRHRTVAAAAVAAVGLGGLWYAVDARQDATAPAPAVAPPAPIDAPIDATPPRVTIDAPGWTLTRAHDGTYRPEQLVVFDPALRFGGPWASIWPATDGEPMYGDPHDVQVGAVTGTLSSAPNLSFLSWTDVAGNRWNAEGWGVGADQLVALGAAAVVDADGQLALTAVPPGLVLAGPEVGAALGRSAEYQFDRDDGASLQISLSAGGDRAMYGRTDGEERSTVEIDGESWSLADSGDGRYRADVQRGFWVWELDGEPFASSDEFVQLVRGVHPVDEATWQASLPEAVVGIDERVSAVGDLLAGVPVPDGFDAGALAGTTTTADRSSLITEVATAVTCAWLGEWFDAVEAGDQAARQAAQSVFGCPPASVSR